MGRSDYSLGFVVPASGGRTRLGSHDLWPALVVHASGGRTRCGSVHVLWLTKVVPA